jgi:hypothetical protein
MDTRSGSLFIATDLNSIKNVARIDRRNAFDVLVSDRAVLPHEIIRGYALFEYPISAPVAPSGPLRLTITDTAGKTYSTTTDRDKKNATDLLQGGLLHVDGTEDITNYYNKFYRDP